MSVKLQAGRFLSRIKSGSMKIRGRRFLFQYGVGFLIGLFVVTLSAVPVFDKKSGLEIIQEFFDGDDVGVPVPTGDPPGSWNWTIEDDTVYINNSWAYLSATPHTLVDDGWVEFELESKQLSGSIDVGFGFNSTTAQPKRIEIWRNYTHNLTGYRWVEQYMNMTLWVTAGENLGMENYGDYDVDVGNENNTYLWNISYKFYEEWEDEWYNGSLIIAFTSKTPPGITPDVNYTFFYYDEAWETYYYDSTFWDWKPFNFECTVVDYSFRDADTWYLFRDIPIQEDVRYKVRGWIDIPFGGLEGSSGKYWWVMKPHAKTIAQSIADGHLLYLDPWWNNSWSYYKVITVADKIEGYQMKINITKNSGGDVDCEGHCNDNFSDIRFVYDNTTELPYWIEETVSGSYSIMWVNNSGNYSSFEMFYGNSAVGNASSGEDTWDWYEDWTADYTGTYTAVKHATLEVYGRFSDNEYTVNVPYRQIVRWRVHTWATDSYATNAMMGFAADENSYYADDNIYFWVGADSDKFADGDTLGNDFRTRVGGTQSTATGYDMAPMDFSMDTWYVTDIHVGSTSWAGCTVYDSSHTDVLQSFSTTSNIPSSVDRNYFGEYNVRAGGVFWNYNAGEDVIEYGGDSTSDGDVELYTPWVCIGKYNATGVTPPSFSAFGSEVFSDIWSNSNPVNSNPDPQNGNTSVSLTPTLRIAVNDVDMANQSVNTTWWSNSEGSWAIFATNTSSSNTTFYQTFTNATEKGTTYYWSVNTSDGNGGWDNDTYSFTTEYIYYYYNETFEDDTVGISVNGSNPDAPWYYCYERPDLKIMPAYVNISNDKNATGGKTCQIWKSNDDTSQIFQNFTLNNGTDNITNVATYLEWWMLSDILTGGSIGLINDEGLMFDVWFTDGPLLQVKYGSSSYATLIDPTITNTWYKVRVVFNWTTDYYQIVVDDDSKGWWSSRTVGSTFKQFVLHDAGHDTADAHFNNFTLCTTNKIGFAPTLSGESPTNTSTDISVTPSLYVVCTDVDSDTMTATWCSNSSNNWVDFATNVSISTGTNITQNNSNFSAYSTTYWWSVNLTDGTDWCNETYHFTTVAPWSNTAPTLTNEDPTNASTGIQRYPQLNITVTDADGNNSEVYWYTNATEDDSWYLLQTNSSVLNETISLMIFSNASAYSTRYWWHVSANDSIDNTTEIYYFTIEAVAVLTLTDEYPTNGSNIFSVQPTLYFTLTSSIGGMIYSLYIGNTNITTDYLLDSDSGLDNGTFHYVNFYNASTPGVTYWWRVHYNDSSSHVNDTFSFQPVVAAGGGMGVGGIAMGIIGLCGLFAIPFSFILYLRLKKRKDPPPSSNNFNRRGYYRNF